MPGESYLHSYVLKFKYQGIFQITATTIEYEYFEIKTFSSNNLTIKVRNAWIFDVFSILIPSLSGIFVITGLYWWKNRYDREAIEFQRREELMFGMDFRSVAWDKFTIEEHLKGIIDGKKISSKRRREEF